MFVYGENLEYASTMEFNASPSAHHLRKEFYEILMSSTSLEAVVLDYMSKNFSFLFQVTFVSGEPLPSEYSRAIKFRNITYDLYSHSFLHFGQVIVHVF